MLQHAFHWLVDSGLPRPSDGAMDTVHASDLDRIPGPAGLTEANAMARCLVTGNHDFAGPWEVPLAHPGVVLFEAPPPDHETLERNLRHLEFRIRQAAGSIGLAGNRFLVKTDRSILHLLPDGRAVSLEPFAT